MAFELQEILETLSMVSVQHFDVRTVTIGLSLLDCMDSSPQVVERKIVNKIARTAKELVPTVDAISRQYGIPVANKRLSVTPMSLILNPLPPQSYLRIAKAIDQVVGDLGIDFVGGYSALIPKGATISDVRLIHSLPEVLSNTERFCSSVSLGSTSAGINMDGVLMVAQAIKGMAAATAHKGGLACAKFVCFCNAVEDNPFMAGAYHGTGEADSVVSVGISGPGVVLSAVQQHPDASIDQLAEVVKKTAFKITRVGQLVLDEASRRLGIQAGIIDLSLAPTPVPGDSVANILESFGLERIGAPGTTAALAILNEAVKRGGAMAATHVGGLSGAFIPVSEDAGMIRAVQEGALTLEKLESMTCVCSVGLDMIAVPGDTSVETIAGIIADEAALGMVNNKTTAVRIIPVPGKGVGEMVEFGGLLGSGPIMAVNGFSCARFARRGGRIPAPLRALTN